MNTFNPDLVVEVTSACNRSCSGCYAPNVVSSKSAQDLMATQPSLFLNVQELERQIMFWEETLPETVSFRGGEPSLHPHISEILTLNRYFAKTLVLETHARWLLKEQRDEYQNLITAIITNNVIVKISFDSMHRLNADKLKEITNFLNEIGVRYLVAVTEKNETDYLATKALAPWVIESSFIFQKKAETVDELIQPRMGIINVSGKKVGALNNKFHSQIDLKAVIG